jgi:hypothetical protein
MEPTKGERAAIIDLSQHLQVAHTGRPLREGEYPCEDVMWQLREILKQSEQSVTDLLNECQSQ